MTGLHRLQGWVFAWCGAVSVARGSERGNAPAGSVRQALGVVSSRVQDANTAQLCAPQTRCTTDLLLAIGWVASLPLASLVDNIVPPIPPIATGRWCDGQHLMKGPLALLWEKHWRR